MAAILSMRDELTGCVITEPHCIAQPNPFCQPPWSSSPARWAHEVIDTIRAGFRRRIGIALAVYIPPIDVKGDPNNSEEQFNLSCRTLWINVNQSQGMSVSAVSTVSDDGPATLGF